MVDQAALDAAQKPAAETASDAPATDAHFPDGLHPDGGGDAIIHDGKKVKSYSYTTDLFARDAAAFIDKHRGEPWFLYLPFNAQHAPLQAPKKYLDRFPAIGDEKRKLFAAMMSAVVTLDMFTFTPRRPSI